MVIQQTKYYLHFFKEDAMKTTSFMTKGFLAALLVVGMATPGLAESLPLHYGPSPKAIIDWEDEFPYEVSTSHTLGNDQVPSRLTQFLPVAPGTPIIDWEDEFPYEVSTPHTTNNKLVQKNKENEASLNFEDWHLM